MKVQKKWTLLFLSVLVSLVSVFVYTSQPVAAEDNFTVKANAAIAIDYDTGKILYAQNADEALGIASMTKMISDYLVLEAVQAGKITWDDQVTIDPYYETLSQNYELSNVPLYAAQTYSVKDLFAASTIASANAAIMVLADHVAGSQEAFVEMMKEKLVAFGINDATIVNVSGLNNSDLGEKVIAGTAADAENYLSAKDVAIVARHLIHDFPEILETTKQTSATFAADTAYPAEMTTWNWMLPGMIDYKEGVDGLKTGTTNIAGACFTGTILKDDTRLITVVMNATDHLNDATARFKETGLLMDYVFANWTKTTYDPTTLDIVKQTLPVDKGKEESVAVTLKATDPVTVWNKNGTEASVDAKIPGDVLNSDGQLVAPVKAGTVVGAVTYSTTDDLGYLEATDDTNLKIDLITKDAVEKASFWQLLQRSVVSFFHGIGKWFSNLF